MHVESIEVGNANKTDSKRTVSCSPIVIKDIILVAQTLSILFGVLSVYFVFSLSSWAQPFSIENLLKFTAVSLSVYFFLAQKINKSSIRKEMLKKSVYALSALAIATIVFPCASIVKENGLGFLFGVITLSLLYLTVLVNLGRRQVNKLYDMNALQHRVAIYGAGDIAIHAYNYIQKKGRREYSFAGLFEDRKADRVDQTIPIKGSLEDLLNDGRDDRFDSVLIALPQSAIERTQSIIKKLEELPIEINVCTHVSDDVVSQPKHVTKVQDMGPIGLLNVKNKPISHWGIWLKKAEDYILSILMLLVAAPIFAIIALAIKLDSRGPVFFQQTRHGLNRREINVLKFRTMYVHQNTKVVQASKNDPRVTRVGRILRKTSLDELPQLINILRGEMSLVGPRPHAISHNEEYGKRVEEYSNRYQLKPGLTGWAQVHGYRGETKDISLMEKRVKYDLAYIDNWSLLLDFRIILMTPIYALVSKNAY